MTHELREVGVVPGPDGVVAVRTALADALAGGPAVAPVPMGRDADGDAYAARIRAALRPDDPGAPLERDDVVAVVSTSGSTGDPRGVLLTEANVRTATAALETRMGGPGDWLASVPMHAVGGLMVAVRALLAGTELHADPSVGGATRFDPAAFADATATAAAGAEARGVRLYTSLVPTQLSRLVAAGELGLDALRHYDCVLSGAAATPLQLLESLRRNGIAVLVSYGMSETCGGCAYDGVPQPGLTFAIDAAEGDGTGDNTGRIRISGRAVAAGYRLRPDEQALSSDADGIGTVVTNDLGTLAADGRVSVLGRVDDVVVVGGTNVALPAIGELLREATGGQVCVIARPDREWGARLVAFLGDVTTTAPAYDDARLAELVRDRLGRAAVPREFVRLAEIPMLVTGKPDRRALQALADR